MAKHRNALLALVLLAVGTTACTPVGVVMTAGATAGVAAAQERGFSAAARDTQIRAEINHLWFQESEKLFLAVSLQVQEGRVLLTGNAPDPETRLTAVRLAWTPQGVKEVINEIEVTDKSSLTNYARDVWINTRLKAAFLFDQEVSSINYSVETVNQSVYLIGIAQDQAELERAIGHAKNISYVRRVVNYVRIKDNPGGQSQ